jgi:hypothetical protein
MTARRFPPPWSIDELEECFVVKDQNGQQLAYAYFEDEPAAIGSQVAQQRRGTADRGEHRQAARIAAALIVQTNFR